VKTLFAGGSIATLTDVRADWVLVEDGSISALGSGDPPPADDRVDLDGGTLVPSFCDAHVHLPATGLYAAGLDLREVKGKQAILQAFAQHAAREGILFAGNFEDAVEDRLTRADIDAVVGDRPALLARADMHSCVVSTALLNGLDADLEGVDRDETGSPTGYLREKAAAGAWRWFDENLPEAEQRKAIRTAIGLALAQGVTEVHEMFVAEWRSWSTLETLLDESRNTALEVVPYVATDEVARVEELGLRTIGGDYFLDGSFGSHTAWLSEPYESSPPPGSTPTGIGYRPDEEVEDFFRAAHAAGLQVGVHAIGDAAIAQALRTWERIAADDASVRTRGHRIEHFECAWDEHITSAAHLGLRISAQPAFDRFWGGDTGLYAERIGTGRASNMNRFRSMAEAGLVVGAGSDSTVTPLDPFLQMAALRDHHVASERMSAEDALRMHCIGSRALGPSPDAAGRLREGSPADLAWLDRDPLEVDPDELLKTEVLGTWKSGRRVWPSENQASS
jgi:predicted amidohydrolase YtcJ